MKSGDLIWFKRSKRIDGVGKMFRFITPLLVSIVLFFLGYVLNNQGKLDDKIMCLQREQYAYFTNHLSNYKDFSVMVESRLTAIEVVLNGKKKK